MTPEVMAATHTAAFADARGWSAAEVSELLAQPGCFVTGDAFCFALVRVIGDEAELLTLATHPDHRRQGHARAVMQSWMETARARGAAQAFLEVAADNAAALALYHDCGFGLAGRRKGYYLRPDGARTDALVLRSALG